MSVIEQTEQVAEAKPARRLSQKYRFDDPDMDLFFMAALGWGPTGGLEVGQAFYVSSQIKDGDADSWVEAFRTYGDELNALADAWMQRGRTQSAGEMRLKAFASYRSAWQFAAPGEQFASIFAMQQKAFVKAMEELRFPVTQFETAYKGKSLPGVFLQNSAPNAPVVLVIGGADTSHEDLFLTIGRRLYERGYSVALADLPGQGITQAHGLHWEAEAEKPIAAITDVLVERFHAQPGRIALVGLSLGGYFVARAAGYDSRFAAVVASTPFPNPAQLFSLSVGAALKNPHEATSATKRAQQITFWKVGAKSVEEFLALTAPMIADPALVTVPFLSILGTGDSLIFAAQAKMWHSEIRSARKEFVLLEAASGADGHVQVNNRLRLVQETCDWLDEIFHG